MKARCRNRTVNQSSSVQIKVSVVSEKYFSMELYRIICGCEVSNGLLLWLVALHPLSVICKMELLRVLFDSFCYLLIGGKICM